METDTVMNHNESSLSTTAAIGIPIVVIPADSTSNNSNALQPLHHPPPLSTQSSTSSADSCSSTLPQLLPPPPQLQKRSSSKSRLSTYQTTSITKHYELNEQILGAFHSNYNSNTQNDVNYHVAYAMGLQFVETALLEIPKHGYFLAPRHERERMTSSLEAVRVTQLLNEVIEKGAIHISSSEQAWVTKLAELALLSVEQASEDQLEHSSSSLQHDDDERCSCSATKVVASAQLSSHKRQSSGTHQPQAPPPPINNNNNNNKRWSSSLNESSSWMSSCRPITSTLDSIMNALCPQDNEILKGDNHDDDDGIPAAKKSAAVVKDSGDMTKIINDIEILRECRLSASSSEERMLKKALYLSGLDMVTTTAPSSSSMLLRLNNSNEQEEETTVRDTSEQRRISSESPETTALPSISPPPIYPEENNDQGIEQTLLQHSHPPQHPPSAGSTTCTQSLLQFHTVAQLYHEDFDAYRTSGRIRVSFVNTYQGRIPGSINGCTVIAPLLCIHHLLNDNDYDNDEFGCWQPDPGLPDAMIVHVIDCETPCILSELRQNLGLSPHAFLIPSDVHDYLIENGQLSQDQFVTVTGGNVLDERHVQTFVHTLANVQSKAAACFFFHEHVVAILNVRRDEQTSWYDVIDGLPCKNLLSWLDETNKNGNNGVFRSLFSGMVDDWLDYSNHNNTTPLLSEIELLNNSNHDHHDCVEFLSQTARIRCLGTDALIACLRWYACSKLSSDNIAYIDRYEWHDDTSDFDPRVFQGFIWGSQSQSQSQSQQWFM